MIKGKNMMGCIKMNNMQSFGEEKKVQMRPNERNVSCKDMTNKCRAENRNRGG